MSPIPADIYTTSKHGMYATAILYICLSISHTHALDCDQTSFAI